MISFPLERDLAFLIHDVARLLRTRADQKARQFGMTRAQWAVLFRVERNEGLKQSELAELLEIRPITLTRLIDRLCENGLMERRSDPADRRAKRLFLMPAAGAMLEQFSEMTRELMTDALAGIDQTVVEQLVKHLSDIKDNLRDATVRPGGTSQLEQRHYG